MTLMSALSIPIDKRSPVPIYFQLKQGIEHLIDSGHLRPGENLPSENELARAYKISPMTARQAMIELVADGYVWRERGRGTFVARREQNQPLENLISFTQDMEARHIRPGSKVLLFEDVPPPEVVAKRISFPPEARLTRIKRLRLADEVPVGIHDAYIYNANLQRADLEHGASLYDLLDAQAIRLNEAEETIEAVAADESTAELLHVKPGAPLLQTTRFSWSDNNRFVEYVVALYHLYRYTIRLRR